jgi:hypothetical protein
VTRSVFASRNLNWRARTGAWHARGLLPHACKSSPATLPTFGPLFPRRDLDPGIRHRPERPEFVRECGSFTGGHPVMPTGPLYGPNSGRSSCWLGPPLTGGYRNLPAGPFDDSFALTGRSVATTDRLRSTRPGPAVKSLRWERPIRLRERAFAIIATAPGADSIRRRERRPAARCVRTAHDGQKRAPA